MNKSPIVSESRIRLESHWLQKTLDWNTVRSLDSVPVGNIRLDYHPPFSASLSSLALWLLLAWIYTTEAALESSPETWRKMRLEQTDYYYIVNHVQGGSRELTLKAKALGDWVLQTVPSRHVNDLS